MRIKHRKVKAKKRYEPVIEAYEKEEEDDSRKVDMTGWEDDFDYSDMSGLFFIIKGQCGSLNPIVTVKNRNEYHEVHVGSYNPYDDRTIEHYCVYDRITFNCTYGGRDFNKAVENVKRVVINHNNDPESYFRVVSESTNEDFYFRHYENASPFTDTQFKKRAEEGRSWKVSTKMKMHTYALMREYGQVYEPFVEEAYESAVKHLENRGKRIRNKMRSARSKKLKLRK